MKFLIGFGSGVYVGSRYDLKPYVDYIEVEARAKFKEINLKLKDLEKKSGGGPEKV